MTKLPFGEVLSESFSFFFANLRLFFHLVTIPWIASLAIRIIGAALAHDSLAAVLVEKALDAVPTAMFMVAWQRAVLLGPNRVDRLPGVGWSPRESAYLIHLVKIAGITFVLIAAFIFTIGTLNPETMGMGAPPDPELARRQAMAAPLGAGFTISLLLALRVSFGLAATAVDVPFSPRLSWAYSRGNAWTIIGLLFLTFFVGALATTAASLVALGLMRGMLGADSAAVLVTWLVAILVSYAGAALAATVQAVIFRRLLAWREGAPLPAVT
ncbi:MAG: hypothetical protein AB7F22_08665 [Reyranella sp.]|uniref:hypothetical protein n=1 Tax=Reyranella sp. TaxID=1929291 RepID=UPI003D127CAA